MRYFLLKLCAALQLIVPFASQSCLRGADFVLQIDTHYDETLLSASVQSPSYLEISPRAISANLLKILDSNFPITIKSSASSLDFLYILDSQSIVIYNIGNIQDPVFSQRLMLNLIQNYEKISVGPCIVLSNQTTLALFTLDIEYPELIVELQIDDGIMALSVTSKQIVIGSPQGVKIFEVVDAEIGLVEVTDFLPAEKFGISQLAITDIYVNGEIYILEKTLGLVQLSQSPLQILKYYNIYGKALTGYQDLVVVDGKFEVNTVTSHINIYNISTPCDFLKMDENFIYCSHEDKLKYISRLLSLITEITYQSIHNLLLIQNFLLISFRDHIEINSIRLGPVKIQGEVPNAVSDVQVKFTVWGSSTEKDSQVFTLQIQYSVMDVVYFIFGAIAGIFIILFFTIALCKYCKRKNSENVHIVQNEMRPVPLNSPVPTDRNVFSERVLIENNSET